MPHPFAASPVRRLLLAMLALGFSACSEAPPPPETAAPSTETATEPAFDLEATMNELAAALELRATLARQVAENPESLDLALADRISDTYYTERVLIQAIKIQMEEEPSWIPSICEWYDAILRNPHFKQTRIWVSTFQKGDNLGNAAATRIFGKDYSDREDMKSRVGREIMTRGFDRFNTEFPNPRFKTFDDVVELYIFCV
ncbi:MAG: hypothetical protein MK085_11860, partial [Phycisphaerales bacterium]|nr:hypothetical protein [Phycisphaerales bacterium]